MMAITFSRVRYPLRRHRWPAMVEICPLRQYVHAISSDIQLAKSLPTRRTHSTLLSPPRFSGPPPPCPPDQDNAQEGNNWPY